MDDPIISRDAIRQCGADAFVEGRGIDDHHMNPHTSAMAIADWQQGWRDRRATVHARDLVKFASGVGTPP
jgi:hypothetical protein